MLRNTQEAATASSCNGQVRLEDRVFGRLVARIREGELALGEKLPSEAVMAADFGVSRPVVRSALALLRDEGLIVSRRGSGSYVSIGSPEEGSGFSPLEGIDDIASVYRFRLMIECEAAALAATRTGPQDIDALEDCASRMESLHGAGAGTWGLDREFHLMIARLSDNIFVIDSLQMLRPHLAFIAKLVRTLGSRRYEDGKKRMNAEHRAIIDALESRDPERARRAMADHIEASQTRVFKRA